MLGDVYYSLNYNCPKEVELDIEITSEEEFEKYKNNIEVVYRVVKYPDLTYEKLYRRAFYEFDF